MNDIPIILTLAAVDIRGPQAELGEVGIRWTLGPTWYDNYGNDGFLPYFDSDPPDETDAVAMAKVKLWAEKMIYHTTDYRVGGWNGLAPILTIERHTLEIWTTDGNAVTYVVPVSTARMAYGRFGDTQGVISLPLEDGRTARVMVRAITRVNSSVAQVYVENE